MRFTPSNLLSLLAVGAILQLVVVPRAITTGLINGRDESGLTKCDVTLGCVDKIIQVPDLEDHAVIPALQKRKGRRPGSNRPNRNGHGKPSKPATGPTTNPKPGPTTKPSSVSTTQPAKTSPTTSKEEPTTSSKVHSSTSSKVVSNTRTTSSVTSSRLTSPSTSRVASTTKPVTSSTTTLGSQTSAHPISSANSSTKSGENSALKSEEQSATPSKTPFITNSTSTTKPTSEAELTTTSEEAHTTAKSGNTAAPTSSEQGSDEYSATESVPTPVSSSASAPTTTLDKHTVKKESSTPIPTETQSRTSSEADPTTASAQEPTLTTEPSLSHGRNNNKNTSILSWEEYMEDDVRAIDIERRYEVKHGEAVIGGVVENKPNIKWDFWKLTRLGENARYARTIVKLQNLEKQGKAKEEVSQDVNDQNKDDISDNYCNKAQKTMVIAWSNVNIDNTETEDTRLRWSDITFEGWKEHASDDVKNLRWIVRNNIISEGTSVTVREAIRRVGRNPDRRVDFAPDPNDSAMNEAFTVLAGTPNVKGVFHMLVDHHEMGGPKVKKIHAFGANMLLIAVGR
ncbi:hypothetical protein A7D00_0315 [Trichophyton violaceum]|uniref:Uncharacterized protein n=1 Tax=Trichophyton violaceum TaxID=34388 RepID=A0A178FQK2_TRIVO|nr:hypothetical protein A7D00_0315 [Trichophyton violaceum]